jgi:mannose-6-phosphate isomerase-like protein (cupin superfamily)
MGCGSSPGGVAEMRTTIMDTNEKGAVHVPPGEGKKLWVAEELMTFVISGEDTYGKYALTDPTVPPRGEAPPHIHHREDEAFWVLEGDLEVLVGEDKIGARGVIHTYKNVCATPARFLTLMVPAGLERFFRGGGKPGTDPFSPPPFGEKDVERLLAIAPYYGAQILPPPEQ